MVRSLTHAGWIGVDLDGTLALYDHWRGDEFIGDPIRPMVNRVKAWIAEGIEVRIVTARVFHPYYGDGAHDEPMPVREVRKAIEDWCVLHIGMKLKITCMKDYGMIELWDDRAIRVKTNTGERCCDG